MNAAELEQYVNGLEARLKRVERQLAKTRTPKVPAVKKPAPDKRAVMLAKVHARIDKKFPKSKAA